MVKHNPHTRHRARGPLREGDYIPEDRGFTSPCWIWVRTISHYGYGHHGTNGRVRMAHRVMYEERVGPIGNLLLHHLCHQRACVRPDHLQPVARSDHHHLHREYSEPEPRGNAEVLERLKLLRERLTRLQNIS